MDLMNPRLNNGSPNPCLQGCPNIKKLTYFVF